MIKICDWCEIIRRFHLGEAMNGMAEQGAMANLGINHDDTSIAGVDDQINQVRERFIKKITNVSLCIHV